MGDNQLELEVQLKLELENDFDDAIFKKIEAAAQKTAKNVDSIFRSSDFATGMLKTSVRDLTNLFKTLNTEAKEYLNSIKQAGKELRKQVGILGSKSASSATNSAIAREEKERERVLQEEQKIRRAIAQQSVADEQKAANERERVLQEEQKTRSAILQSNTREQIKHLAKVTAGLGVLKKAFSDGYQALYKFTKLTHEMTVNVVKAFGTMTSSITTFALKLSGLPLILKGINSALSSLTSAIKGAVSGIDFTGLAKESLELSSSLTEVKNVIDQVFGDNAQTIYDFTQSAIKNLGMTTLAAQQYAGKFGAAMRSTGQAAKDTVNMSKALTQLTSDIASFYDIEQDIAAEKIFSGVISGMVKPMRTLGVDMTNASLNAWMLAKGLNATYESLNATQKQAVRFEYVMEKLDYVHGDYARTLNTTANQLRLLKNQLKELGSVVGAIINAFFNPFIITLNRVVAAITNVAKSIASIMGIDWTLGTGSGVSTLGGIADDYDDLADSADGLADAEDGVAKSTDKAAKAAKKALAPFHKLNVLQNKQAEDASKSAKSSGKNSGTPYDIAGEGIKNTESKAIDLKQALKNLYDYLMKINWKKAFGRLADAINSVTKDLPKKIRDLFEKVNKLWAKIIEGIDEFLKKLNTYDIGRSIGEIFKGVGDLIYTTLSGIDFKNLGNKFADLLNGILNTEGLAETWGKNLGKAIQDGFEFALGFAKQFDWKNFGQKVYEFVAGALSEIDPKTIHDAIFTTLTGIATSINEFFDNLEKDEESKTKFEEVIGAIVSGVTDFLYSDEFADLVDNLSGFISDVLDTLATELDKDENKEKIGAAFDKILEGAGKVLKSGENLASVVWEYVKKALVDFFTSKDKDIPVPFRILGAVEIANLTGVTSVVQALLEGAIFAKLMGLKVPLGAIASTVGTILIGVTAIYLEWKLLSTLVKEFTGLEPSFEQFFKSIVNYLKICYGIIAGIDGAIKSFMGYGLANFLEILGEILGKIPGIGTGLQEACNKGSQALKGLVDNMNENHQKTMDSLTTMSNKWGDFGKSIDDAKGKVGLFGEQVGTSMDDAEKSLSKIPVKIHEVDGEIRNAASESKRSVDSEWAKEITAAGIDNLSSKFNTEYGNIDKDTKDTVNTVNNILADIGGDSVDWAGLFGDYDTLGIGGLESSTTEGVTNINTELGNIGSTLTSESFSGVNAAFNEGVIVPIQVGISNLGLDIQKAFSEALIATEGTWTPFSAWWGENVSNLILGNVATFNSLLSTANTTEYTAITGIWQPLPNYIQTNVLTILDGYISPWFGTLEGTNNEYLGKLTDIWKVFPDYVKTNVTEKVIELIQKLFEQAEKDTNNGIKEMKSAWDDLYKHIDGVVKDISSRLDDLISKAKEAATEISNAASASNSINTSSYSSSSVQGYATGGVFRPNNPQLALLGDHKSQTEYALTTGHLKQIADMMSNIIGSSGFEGNITIPIYVDGVLSAKKVITASQMHNYRSNGR